jgi:hypothetical protein
MQQCVQHSKQLVTAPTLTHGGQVGAATTEAVVAFANATHWQTQPVALHTRDRTRCSANRTQQRVPHGVPHRPSSVCAHGVPHRPSSVCALTRGQLQVTAMRSHRQSTCLECDLVVQLGLVPRQQRLSALAGCAGCVVEAAEESAHGASPAHDISRRCRWLQPDKSVNIQRVRATLRG